MMGPLRLPFRRHPGEGRVLWSPGEEPPEDVKLRADGESLRRLAAAWPDFRARPVPGSGERQWQIDVANLPGLYGDEAGGYRVRDHQRFELRLAPGYTRCGFRFFSLLPLAGPHVALGEEREVCLTGDLGYLKASRLLAARAVPVLANVVSLRAVNSRDIHDTDVWDWMGKNGVDGPLTARDYCTELDPLLDEALSGLERRLGWAEP